MAALPALWRPLALLVVACALVGCRPHPSTGDGGANDGGPDAGDADKCSTRFSFRPSATATSVAVLGEWVAFAHGFAQPMADDGTGSYQVTLQLPPGTYGYVFLVNGGEQLDPANAAVRTVEGKTYSRLVVGDCYAPALAVKNVQVTPAGPSQGTFRAELALSVPVSPGAIRVEGTVRTPTDRVTDGWQPRALTAAELTLSPDGKQATVLLSALADGKYTVKVRAFSDQRAGADLLLPFWMEPMPFSFLDSPVYMVVTDRFRDGDPSNNPAPTPNVPISASFQGGDLKGVELAISEGYFDQLGVRELWLTPWQTQPSGAYPDLSQTHSILGYHGYWPIKARQVDPRLGGSDALHRVVEEAHRHGIRIVMDAVLNHVHQEHEYFQDPAKKSWFREGCICGTQNCDFEGPHSLDCRFAPYMPDVNWTVSEAADQFISDVAWWVEEYDLDALRVDAVKQVEDSAIIGLTKRIRERFEQAGTDYYMFGETFTGNSDLINHSIGPAALDGQLDFPLFFQVPETVFARDDLGFQHVKYWTEQSLLQFPDAPMVRFVGNHDVARFITKADPANRDRQGSQWDNLPGAPSGQEPYDRLWLAMLNLMTIPGVPLVYYGDEYGEFGGSDPDNRHMANHEPNLWPEQRDQLARMKKLLQARAKLRGLSRGPMTTLWANSEDNGKGNLWAYMRKDSEPRQSAVVVLNRTGGTWGGVVVSFPAELGWASGRVYDLLTDREWTITNGAVTLDVPGRGGVILGLR